jgi:hypothetical protein
MASSFSGSPGDPTRARVARPFSGTVPGRNPVLRPQIVGRRNTVAPFATVGEAMAALPEPAAISVVNPAVAESPSPSTVVSVTPYTAATSDWQAAPAQDQIEPTQAPPPEPPTEAVAPDSVLSVEDLRWPPRLDPIDDFGATPAQRGTEILEHQGEAASEGADGEVAEWVSISEVEASPDDHSAPFDGAEPPREVSEGGEEGWPWDDAQASDDVWDGYALAHSDPEAAVSEPPVRGPLPDQPDHDGGSAADHRLEEREAMEVGGEEPLPDVARMAAPAGAAAHDSAERAALALEAVARMVRSREIVVSTGAGASAESVLASILASLLSHPT